MQRVCQLWNFGLLNIISTLFQLWDSPLLTVIFMTFQLWDFLSCCFTCFLQNCSNHLLSSLLALHAACLSTLELRTFEGNFNAISTLGFPTFDGNFDVFSTFFNFWFYSCCSHAALYSQDRCAFCLCLQTLPLFTNWGGVQKKVKT